MWGGMAILKNKMGGKCANTHRPVWGTSPGFVQSKFFAPVREPPPTGATALEVHKMNRHSRKNGGKPSCQHVPEEVLHGVTSFRRSAPLGENYTAILFLTTLLRTKFQANITNSFLLMPTLTCPTSLFEAVHCSDCGSVVAL